MGVSRELHKLLENYQLGRLQMVALNGQPSLWRPVLTGVPQGSTLGPLLLFIYINDLPNEMKSNTKLFADDTSLFTIVKDKTERANVLKIIYYYSPGGLITGKCFLTQTLVNQSKK